MFSQETIAEIENVARQNGIDPAALLAIAEVESGGKAFAYVGGRKEPLIRFEGHYFDRLINAAYRTKARAAGLAATKWGVVKNPRSQADRWKLLARASKLDKSAALQSVSWGIGQVMGSHWKALGYESPDALVAEARSSIAGQVRLMLRFIESNGLSGFLAKRDWASFARRYNGPAYRKNAYDTRMAAAYARHKNRRLLGGRIANVRRSAPVGWLWRGAKNNIEAVRELQNMLTSSGFATPADGDFGLATERALKHFQQSAGLNDDGIYGPKTKAALEAALPKLSDPVWLLRLVAKLKSALRLVNFLNLFKRVP